MNKTVTRSGITIGCAFSSTLPPAEAAPLKIRRPRFDAADRAVMIASALSLLALVAILVNEWLKVPS